MVTPIFICGAECGIETVGSTGLAPHWDSIFGAPAVSTAIFHYGLRSYRFNPLVSAARQLDKTISTTRLVGTAAIYFTTLPNGTTALIRAVPTAGSWPTIRFNVATSRLEAWFDDGGGIQAGPVVATGVWYVIDWDFNLSGATATIDWRVNGVVQTQSSFVQASATMTRFDQGVNGNVMDMYIDDTILSYTAADYPIGAAADDGYSVKVLGFSPDSSGAHSFTAGDFQDNVGNNIALPDGDVHSFIDEVPITSTADYIKQVVVRSDGYIRFGFEDTGETNNALGVEVVSSQRAAGANSKAAFNLDDGGTLGTIYPLSTISFDSLIYNTKQFATAPSGGAWTKAKINALAARWGYSTVTTPNPYLDGVILEIGWAVTAPPPPVTASRGSNIAARLVAQNAI